jgi:tetratricopeptide (TPR) repeat protein
VTKKSLFRTVSCTATFLLLAMGASGAGAQRADALIRQGLTALHYFEYEEANEAFRKAQAVDPGSVLACWGEAMTYHQTLWRNENVPAGRRALARLGATPATREASARNETERMLLSAADVLFGDGNADSRKRRYADAMRRLYDAEPGDPDIASFYALALLGTMSRGLIGYVDAHEGHSASLAGSETQAEVASILQKVLKAHPDHPGALHYLLHDDDDPAHARQALDAARALAKLAPDASHALHMPAHIFLQLGLWREASASDTAAFRASDEWIARKRLPQALRNYHALAWLQYELLQQGRYREAQATLAQLEPVVKASGQSALLSDLSTMRARYVVETSSWSMLANETTFGNVNDLFAIGVSAARTGQHAAADRARQALAAKQADEREGDMRPAIAIMERELAGVIAFAAGRRDEALSILTGAAQAERKLPDPLGLPAPLKPAPELTGEILVEAGRANEAESFFRQTLERNPNRSLSVLGLARAAAARGDAVGAQQHYRQLLENYSGADAELAVVSEARAALAKATAPTAAPPSGSPTPRIVAIAASIAAVVAVAAFIARRRRDRARQNTNRTRQKGRKAGRP